MGRDRELPPPLEMLCLNALWEISEGNVEDVRKVISQARPLAYTTVLTLLDQNQSIEETAAAMHLHRNTVRYRVTRFRELTGLDIRRTHDLVTTWWLLEWRRARTRS